MEENNQDSEDAGQNTRLYDPKLDLSGYQCPTLDLLPESVRPVMQQVSQASKGFILPLLLSESQPPTLRELYHHPNVLLAGTISSGKTQFVYNQLVCWLLTKHPAEIKFVICRSKPVDYNSIAKIERHFLAKLPSEEFPIIEGQNVFSSIDSLNIECDARLNLFGAAAVKNIQDYNAKFIKRQLNPEEGHRYLPDIVLIMDDLSTFLDRDTSTSIIRLTQQNLYTGIYVIAVTSQIMARNISPQLRANFSLRLAMKLMSQNESRKILDRVGAEKLTQPGELLYEMGDTICKGVQPFIDYKQIIDVSDFIGSQRGYPSAMLLPEYIDLNDLPFDDFGTSEHDPMFEDAARLVVLYQQGSTTLIQRKLKLGYNRSGRIMDQLEAAGIVGPFEGSKAREVLFPDEYSLEIFLDGTSNPHGQRDSKSTSFRTGKPELVKAPKKLKTGAPSGQNKNTTIVITWMIVLLIVLLVFLMAGWESVVRWFK